MTHFGQKKLKFRTSPSGSITNLIPSNDFSGSNYPRKSPFPKKYILNIYNKPITSYPKDLTKKRTIKRYKNNDKTFTLSSLFQLMRFRLGNESLKTGYRKRRHQPVSPLIALMKE